MQQKLSMLTVPGAFASLNSIEGHGSESPIRRKQQRMPEANSRDSDPETAFPGRQTSNQILITPMPLEKGACRKCYRRKESAGGQGGKPKAVTLSQAG